MNRSVSSSGASSLSSCSSLRLKSFKTSSSLGDGGGDGLGGVGSFGGMIPYFRRASLLQSGRYEINKIGESLQDAYNSVSSFGLTAMLAEERAGFAQ